MALILLLAGLLFLFVLFVFDMNRMQLAQTQLTFVCDSAALTGTSMLSQIDVSHDDKNYAKLRAARKAAALYARNMICNNSILGTSLEHTSEAMTLDSLGANLKPNEARYLIGLADIDGNNVDLDISDPSYKTMTCFLSYAYYPFLMQLLQLPPAVLTAKSFGGLAQIDALVVLDSSCAMDDQTVVSFVRREWIHDPRGAVNKVTKMTPGCGIIQYVTLPCSSSPHTIANYLKGEMSSKTIKPCMVNALPPQNLDQAILDSKEGLEQPLTFDAYLRSHYAYSDKAGNYKIWPAAQEPYYRAYDYGTPPGNCDLAIPLGGNGDGITDLNGNDPPLSTVLPCAFTDISWKKDAGIEFNAQCAAPGALHAQMNNDPLTDQQTFTDLVVNIADPEISGPSHRVTKYPYEQALQGPDKFSGFSYTFPLEEPDTDLRGRTFRFPNIAVVVEAARGNLERTPYLPTGKTNFESALLNRPILVDGQIYTIDPDILQNGYQKAYQRLAMMFSQPMATAASAIDQRFFQMLHQEANCRFGFISFSSKGSFDKGAYPYSKTQATLPDLSANPNNRNSFYLFCPPYGELNYSNPVFFCGRPTRSGLNEDKVIDKGDNTINATGTNGFRIPRVALDVEKENYLESISENSIGKGLSNCWSYLGNGADGLDNCRPLSVCDTSEALKTAYGMFHSKNYDVLDRTSDFHNRPGSHRFIVFVTGGLPTDGIKSQEGKDSTAVAGLGPNTFRQSGIPIFTIGINLANNKTLAEHQEQFLGSNGTGLAALAGYGSKYSACTTGARVKESFSSIVRQMSLLQ